jgi:iron complex transport system substrate-binding protein
MRRTTSWLVLVLLVEFLLAASFAGSEQANPPQRVATLLPFVEDALAFAEERADVVASVRRSLHEPIAAGLVDLGNPHSPNLERLAESRPDLVIGDRSLHARLAEPISRLGARLLLLDISGVDETFDSLEAVSGAVGRSPTLENQIHATRSEIDSLSVDAPAKILALFGTPGSFFVMTDRAWLGDLARKVGFENVLADGQQERFPGLVPVSDEVIAMARPDLVLLVAHGDPTRIRAELVRRSEQGGAWGNLSAARLGVHVLDPNLFGANPGLKLSLAARALVRLADSPTTPLP